MITRCTKNDDTVYYSFLDNVTRISLLNERAGVVCVTIAIMRMNAGFYLIILIRTQPHSFTLEMSFENKGDDNELFNERLLFRIFVFVSSLLSPQR